MEKNQFNLCLEILHRLHKSGVLKNIIIIGSWCIPFYRQYFGTTKYRYSITTRDIDFLVPVPPKFGAPVDIAELLKDLGFIIGFKGSKGYIKLEHPELIIEFLVPEKGRGTDKPYPLPQLGLNAQPLRFLTFLTANLIRLKIEGMTLTLPHPANFALHKLIIFQRRTSPEKKLKDKDAAINILKALVDKGETRTIKRVFDAINQPWQQKIIKGLAGTGEKELLEIIRR